MAGPKLIVVTKFDCILGTLFQNRIKKRRLVVWIRSVYYWRYNGKNIIIDTNMDVILLLFKTCEGWKGKNKSPLVFSLSRSKTFFSLSSFKSQFVFLGTESYEKRRRCRGEGLSLKYYFFREKKCLHRIGTKKSLPIIFPRKWKPWQK